MSYIAFTSDEGRVEISGRERARMGGLIDDIAWVMHTRGDSDMRHDDIQRVRWVHGGSGIADNQVFGERLGYVCLIGDDVTKLLCHIHGQCEINGWVHPDEGEWFADLVEQGVSRGLLYDDPGYYGTWGEVAELVRSSKTPVVSSYSVTEGGEGVEEGPRWWPRDWGIWANEVKNERPFARLPEETSEPGS